MDVYPFVWNKFSEEGYVTCYGEDMAKYGIYNLRLKGFDKQPTDHFPQTFFLKTEKDLMTTCIGPEPQHLVSAQQNLTLGVVDVAPLRETLLHAILE